MAKILITGAAGFIGSNLVDFLLKDGVKKTDLRLFVLRGESLENLQHNNLDIYQGDILNKRDVENAIKDVSVIYHLAAHTTGKDSKKFEVNFKGTQNLVNASRNRKIKKFVLFSSIAIYGLPAFVGDKGDISEKTKTEVIGAYALSKKKAEDKVILGSKKYGFSYTIIRPTTVYGPRDLAGIYQLYKMIKKGLFVRIGNGKNKVDYVYVLDLVKAARLGELNKRSGDYIIGSGIPIEFGEMVNCISKSIGVNLANLYVPKVLAIFIGYLIDFLKSIFNFDIPFSADRAKVMTTNYYFDSSKAKRELGYTSQISFCDGAKLTAKWLTENQLI